MEKIITLDELQALIPTPDMSEINRKLKQAIDNKVNRLTIKADEITPLQIKELTSAGYSVESYNALVVISGWLI